MADLLYIYDATNSLMKGVASVNSDGNLLTRLGIRGGLAELRRELSRLVAQGWVFQRAVFNTHGNAGVIAFDNADTGNTDFLHHYEVKSMLGSSNYDRLFPYQFTRIYFSGCNVAEGDEGWAFLTAAGEALLKNSDGGSTFGWTSKGFGMTWWTPLVLNSFATSLAAGNVVHVWGDVRVVIFGHGGRVLERYVPSEEQRLKNLDHHRGRNAP
jgi:hypothetical protein